MTSSSIALILLGLLTFSGAYGIECPDGWTTFQDSCYVHGTTNMTHSMAELYCQGEGGHLVHIESEAEQTFLRNYLLRVPEYRHWIGLSDKAEEGTYVWTDGTTTGYTKWQPGQPDDSNGADCVAITHQTDYHWVDSKCGHFLYPLCEKRSGGVSPTAVVG